MPISVRTVCQEQVQRVRRHHRRRLRLPAVRGERAATSWPVAASARRAVVSADRSTSRRSHHPVTPARTATRIRTAGTKISNGHCSTNRSSTGRLPLGPRPIWSPALSVAARDHPVVSTPSLCRVAPWGPVTSGSVSPTRDSSAGPQAAGGRVAGSILEGAEHLTSGGAPTPPAAVIIYSVHLTTSLVASPRSATAPT